MIFPMLRSALIKICENPMNTNENEITFRYSLPAAIVSGPVSYTHLDVYKRQEELTPTLLREFVEKIVVHECSYDENNTRRQDIEIYYSFVGKVDLPE